MRSLVMLLSIMISLSQKLWISRAEYRNNGSDLIVEVGRREVEALRREI